MRTIECKDREEWLNARGIVGASDIAAIVGFSPLKTAKELLEQKRNGEEQKLESPMTAGTFLEDGISKMFEYNTGAEIVAGSEGYIVVVSDKNEDLRVSPDRFISINGMRTIAEIKNTGKYLSECPIHWWLQVQYQLHVCDLEWGHITWLSNGQYLRYRIIKRDREVGALCEDAAVNFINLVRDEELTRPVPEGGYTKELIKLIARYDSDDSPLGDDPYLHYKDICIPKL